VVRFSMGASAQMSSGVNPRRLGGEADHSHHSSIEVKLGDLCLRSVLLRQLCPFLVLRYPCKPSTKRVRFNGKWELSIRCGRDSNRSSVVRGSS
jgi:hypothetical protein